STRDTVDDSELIPPPEESSLEIYQAAKIGDIEAITKAAQSIKLLAPRYHAFCDRVLQLAAEFDDAAIIKLVERASRPHRE
ncbi:MAG: hypothetical protein F6K35_52035, partial [Okeania sp. SIO2H7]|nr:hypothetical protein [Okeania sp. SIO2H7]